jgi:hypothetical protein
MRHGGIFNAPNALGQDEDNEPQAWWQQEIKETPWWQEPSFAEQEIQTQPWYQPEVQSTASLAPPVEASEKGKLLLPVLAIGAVAILASFVLGRGTARPNCGPRPPKEPSLLVPNCDCGY